MWSFLLAVVEGKMLIYIYCYKVVRVLYIIVARLIFLRDSSDFHFYHGSDTIGVMVPVGDVTCWPYLYSFNILLFVLFLGEQAEEQYSRFGRTIHL